MGGFQCQNERRSRCCGKRRKRGKYNIDAIGRNSFGP